MKVEVIPYPATFLGAGCQLLPSERIAVLNQCRELFPIHIPGKPKQASSAAMPLAYHLLFFGVVVLAFQTFRIVFAGGCRACVRHNSEHRFILAHLILRIHFRRLPGKTCLLASYRTSQQGSELATLSGCELASWEGSFRASLPSSKEATELGN
jgi:hypothetical protein